MRFDVNKIFPRLHKTTPSQIESIVFFVGLFIALFMGDGRQSFVDVLIFWDIILLFILLFLLKKQTGNVPKNQLFGWVLLLVFMALRTVFSDGVGDSLVVSLRYIAAFLVYSLFYSLGTKKNLFWYVWVLIAFVIAAIVSSLVFVFSPSLVVILPKMNLLYASYGHNHLIDLIILSFSSVLFVLRKKMSFMRLGIYLILLFGIVFSFARGAYVLFGVFILAYALEGRVSLFKKQKVLLFGSVFLMVTVFSLLTFNFGNQKPSHVLLEQGWLERQLKKPSLFQDGRFGYWRQAIVSFREHPWFGSGSGTFYLQSKRLQLTPESYSWFAHSFPLQFLAEEGVVGAIIFLFLLLNISFPVFYHIKHNPHTKNDEICIGLLLGILLMAIYSCIDYSLDYIVVWLLLWSMIGVVSGYTRRRKVPSARWYCSVCTLSILALLMYCLSYSISILLATFTSNPYIPYLYAPYRSDLATYILNEPQVEKIIPPQIFLKEISFFQENNADVLVPLAVELVRFDKVSEAKRLFFKAIFWDPLQMNNHKAYVDFLIKQKQYEDIASELLLVSQTFLTKQYQQELHSVNFSSPFLYPAFTQKTFYYLNTIKGFPLSGAILYYRLGLSVINTDPSLTLHLWTLSKNLTPEWSYYHLELASFYQYILRDNSKAESILNECKKFSDPRKACAYAQIHALMQPGYYKDLIDSILYRNS